MHKYIMCLCERWLIDESGPLVQLVTDIRTDILKLLFGVDSSQLSRYQLIVSANR